MLLIVAIAWIYVVLMMSIAEQSVIAGIMTFLLYCVLPLTIVLYLLATPQRLRRRNAAIRAADTQPEDAERSIIASVTSSMPAPSKVSSNTKTEATPGQQPDESR